MQNSPQPCDRPHEVSYLAHSIQRSLCKWVSLSLQVEPFGVCNSLLHVHSGATYAMVWWRTTSLMLRTPKALWSIKRAPCRVYLATLHSLVPGLWSWLLIESEWLECPHQKFKVTGLDPTVAMDLIFKVLVRQACPWFLPREHAYTISNQSQVCYSLI